MRAATLVLALAALAGPLAAQQPQQLTLAQALDLAAHNSPTMVQARQDVRVASAQERQAFGTFLPTVNSSASTSKSGAQRIDATTGRPTSTSTPLWNDRYSLSASLDLFTGFRRGANRRAASATTDARQATELRQEYAVALATKQAFFSALATRELVAVGETRLRRAQEQLNLVTERLRLGATTRSDSLRARVEYGNAQLQLIQAQANLRTAQANLARAVGLEGGLVDAVADTLLEARITSLDTAALRREALATAPTVREATASVTATRAQLRASRAVYLPTLTTNASTSWGRANPDFMGGSPFTRSWQVGFSINYPIFNGFQRETNVITADANATAAEARLRDARLLLDANLTQAFAALDAASARIDVARMSLTAAEEDLRLQRERYRLGASTIFEVLTSQVSADQAQVDLVQARYDYLVARAQLEAYVGHSL